MNALRWLDDSLSFRLVQTLLHFLWQGTLVAIVAGGVEQLLRGRSAHARYLLNVFAMTAMVCCLPLTFARLGAPSEVERKPVIGQEPAPPQAPAEIVALEAMKDHASQKRMSRGGNFSTPIGNAPVDAGSVEELVISSDDAAAAPGGSALVPASMDDKHWRSGSVLTAVAPYVATAYLACVLALLVRLAIGVW